MVRVVGLLELSLHASRCGCAACGGVRRRAAIAAELVSMSGWRGALRVVISKAWWRWWLCATFGGDGRPCVGLTKWVAAAVAVTPPNQPGKRKAAVPGRHPGDAGRGVVLAELPLAAGGET
jgi:hypothetical protein